MKILIADDDEFTTELIRRKLSDWGYEDLLCLSDGREALDYLKSRTEPVLSILDWMMPGKSGDEVYLELPPDDSRPLFRILLTARNTTEDMLYGLDCGADRYLTKPIDFNELQAAVEEGARALSPDSP